MLQLVAELIIDAGLQAVGWAAMKGIAPNREDVDAKRPAPSRSSVPITARPADPEPA